jgi:predicted ester cyclase
MGYRWIAAYRRGKLRGLKDIVRAMRAGFPDIVFSIQEQITEGDRHVCVWGIVIDRLDNGRIKDTRISMDTLGLTTQLGALPSSPTP